MSIEDISQEKITEVGQYGMDMLMTYGPKAVTAIVILIVGLWVIRRLVAVVDKHFVQRAEPTLAKFLSSLISVFLKTVLIIVVASTIGIQTTSLIAVLGAAGLAVGLALQGSLSNFAGGVLILIFKPFKVGDLIEAQGFIATVKEIQIFNTILVSADNRLIIIPNGSLSNGCMVNINHEPTRRVDFVFGIGYSDDIDKAKSIIQSVVDAEERGLKDPAPLIVVSELADSSVNFTVRVWVNTSDYWGVYFAMHENVKKAFDAQGISIPFPQRDVHIHNQASA
jgi:small conductance mechanosensitive channel